MIHCWAGRVIPTLPEGAALFLHCRKALRFSGLHMGVEVGQGCTPSSGFTLVWDCYLWGQVLFADANKLTINHTISDIHCLPALAESAWGPPFIDGRRFVFTAYAWGLKLCRGVEWKSCKHLPPVITLVWYCFLWGLAGFIYVRALVVYWAVFPTNVICRGPPSLPEGAALFRPTFFEGFGFGSLNFFWCCAFTL